MLRFWVTRVYFEPLICVFARPASCSLSRWTIESIVYQIFNSVYFPTIHIMISKSQRIVHSNANSHVASEVSSQHVAGRDAESGKHFPCCRRSCDMTFILFFSLRSWSLVFGIQECLLVFSYTIGFHSMRYIFIGPPSCCSIVEAAPSGPRLWYDFWSAACGVLRPCLACMAALMFLNVACLAMAISMAGCCCGNRFPLPWPKTA